MSTQHFDTVKRFLSCFRSAVVPQHEQDVLDPKVQYDWFVAQDHPIRRSLEGRAEVISYLSLLQATYQILESDEHTIFSNGDKVAVVGGERAKLIRTGQTVRTDWTAVFEFEAGRIKKITMTIYNWVILDVAPAKQSSPRRDVTVARRPNAGSALSYASHSAPAVF